jgi:purine-binding chemotaxis protein CheW
MTVPEQLVVCALGSEQYGLPIDQVREIVRYVEPRPVAADDDGVRGVIGLRGRLLPVHDLGARLGFGASASQPPASAKIVVVDAGDEPAGVIVDDVVEVVTIAPEQVEEVPAASAGGHAALVAKLGERLVLLLDVAALLDERHATAAPGAAPAPAVEPVSGSTVPASV